MRMSVQKRTIALSVATTFVAMVAVMLGNFVLWSLVADGEPRHMLRDSFNTSLAVVFFSIGMFFFDRKIGKGNPTASELGILCTIMVMGIALPITMQVASHKMNEVVGAIAMITGLITVVNFAVVYYLGKIYGAEYRDQVQQREEQRHAERVAERLKQRDTERSALEPHHLVSWELHHQAAERQESARLRHHLVPPDEEDLTRQ